jgi:hypothetical protein
MNKPRVSWSLADLTELDLRLREEIRLTPAEMKPGVDLPRPVVVHTWLRERRRGNPEPQRTAERLVRAEWVLRVLAFGLLFFSGVGAALGLLQYEGDRLINVSLYLGTLVFGQLALLLILALSKLLLRRTAGSVYRNILFHVFEGRHPGIGRMEPLRSLPVWTARGFASMQCAAAGFNLGVLAATFVRGVTGDLAFGWATTLDLGAEQMARLTSTLAAPWGGAFAPTPEQIAFSRIVLKDGLTQVDPRAAAAWWPFLMMCVLVYGFLPRLLLALLGSLQVRMRLSRVRLDDPACERLYLRLTRRSLQFQAADAAREVTPVPQGSAEETVRPPGPVHVFKPSELEVREDALSEAVAGLLEVPVASISAEDQLPETVPAGGLVLVRELWQPPLEETLHRLRQLRESLPPNTDLTLIGIGYPEEGRILTLPDVTDVRVWQSALNRLSDPYLQLIAWPG